MGISFTERHSRASIREERDLLGALLDSVEVGVVACGQDGRLTHVNRRARELVGVDCGIGSDPQTWIKQCRLRSPEVAAQECLGGEVAAELVEGAGIAGTASCTGLPVEPVHDRSDRIGIGDEGEAAHPVAGESAEDAPPRPRLGAALV